MNCESCGKEFIYSKLAANKRFCGEKCRKKEEHKRYKKAHPYVPCKRNKVKWILEPKTTSKKNEEKQPRKPRERMSEEEKRAKKAAWSRAYREKQKLLGIPLKNRYARSVELDPTFREKEKARLKLRHAVKVGRIAKPETCERCKKKDRIHGHHYRGYDHPYNVIWLCPACHSEAHMLNK